MSAVRAHADPVATRLRIACAVLLGVGVFLLLQPFFPSIGYSVRTAVSGDNAVPLLPSFREPTDEPTAAIAGESTLTIPKIGVAIAVIEGDDERALDSGAWRVPTTSANPTLGNMALAAHRYKRKPPASETFYLLDKLEPGDELTLAWRGTAYRYAVTTTQVVEPTAVEVLAPTTEPTLTLITCTPLFSTAQRLVVTAKLL